MKHIHLKECPSTQSFLKAKLEGKGPLKGPLLVSASHQAQAVGRGGAAWTHTANSIGFSLALAPHPEASLTPLEVGAALLGYFAGIGQQLSLKWPNDLLNSGGQKCGGILCTLVAPETVIVGVGLNWGEAPSLQDADIAPGAIESGKRLSESEQEKLSYQIASHLLENRLSSENIRKVWNEHCFHLGKMVSIADNGKRIDGLFKELGPKGEAVIEQDGQIKTIVTGSLSLL